MRDLFGTLAARALGVAADIAPRVPSRFEPVEPSAPAGGESLLSAFDAAPVSESTAAASAAGESSSPTRSWIR